MIIKMIYLIWIFNKKELDQYLNLNQMYMIIYKEVIIDDDENDPDTQGNEPIAVVDTNETQMSPRSRKKRDKEELDE